MEKGALCMNEPDWPYQLLILVLLLLLCVGIYMFSWGASHPEADYKTHQLIITTHGMTDG